MTSTKSIAAAIKAIPAKKDDLKKAFEELQAHSSSLASFTLQWKDLEDHISSIERSIEGRFRDLESKEKERPAAAVSPPSVAAPAMEEEPELDPRPELRSLCVKMDGKGLRMFINENRKDLMNLRKELNRAIRAASDPAKLILDAVEGFYPAKFKAEPPSEGDLANRRTCVLLLERIHVISPEIKPPVRERAKKLATEWKGKMSPDGGQNNVETLAFLQLLVSYGIMSEFEAGDLFDLLVPVAKRRQTVDLCKNLGLSDKMPDFIQKLSSRGKKLDAVKFVYAFELVDKFPPVPLLREHVNESKKIAQDVRKKGNNSAQSQNEATAKELAALRAVIKSVEEYKLESEYSPESLQKRVTQLEHQKAEKKRSAASAALTNPKGQARQQQANKRPRPSTTSATTAVAAHPTAPLSQTSLPLIDRASYMASTGPYGLTGNSYLYEHTGSAYTANPLGLGATRSPPRSLLYSDPLAGSSLYDRSGAYGSYSLSGGLPSQYNSSLYR
uniref:FRIGIDA-like protein n=1 Tax=Anthurium amnicola TaxID=1678845 RepID=A0A1D1XYA1_9ARAE